jgi:hypothetical protein
MSKPIRIEWPVADEEAVCLEQEITAAGNLSINGNLANTSVPNPYAEFLGLERKVSLTSAQDLSTVNFIITGYFRGALISTPAIVGPNAGTIEPNYLFTRIVSVSVDAGFPAPGDTVKIGSGHTGNTIWLRSDYQRAVNNLTVGVGVVANNITYTFETSIDDPIINNEDSVFAPVDGVTIPTIPAATDMIDATVGVVANYTWPTHSSRVRVSASNDTGSLVFYFLQQGQV